MGGRISRDPDDVREHRARMVRLFGSCRNHMTDGVDGLQLGPCIDCDGAGECMTGQFIGQAWWNVVAPDGRDEIHASECIICTFNGTMRAVKGEADQRGFHRPMGFWVHLVMLGIDMAFLAMERDGLERKNPNRYLLCKTLHEVMLRMFHYEDISNGWRASVGTFASPNRP
jgi:hypothetical protein